MFIICYYYVFMELLFILFLWIRHAYDDEWKNDMLRL